MGLFRKGKTHMITKIHWTDLVICSPSRKMKPLYYSQINTVVLNIRARLFKTSLA